MCLLFPKQENSTENARDGQQLPAVDIAKTSSDAVPPAVSQSSSIDPVPGTCSKWQANNNPQPRAGSSAEQNNAGDQTFDEPSPQQQGEKVEQAKQPPNNVKSEILEHAA